MGQQVESRAAGTDAKLCALAQAGDRRAADTLVRRYRLYAYAVAGRMRTPLSDNADMRQEGNYPFEGEARGGEAA